MKQLVGNFGNSSYTFSASAKTVTINQRPKTLTLESLLAIVNITTQEIIYQPNKTTKGATLSGDIFTLERDTTAMSDTDSLMVLIDSDETAYDANLDVKKVIPQANSPKLSWSEEYTAFTPVDTNFDEGTVIDTQSDKAIILCFSKTASDSDDTLIKVNTLLSFDATVDYQQSSISSPTGGETTISSNVYKKDKASAVEMIYIDEVGPYTRIDMSKKTNVGTDSTITCSIIHIPR